MSSLIVCKPMDWIFKTKNSWKQAIFMADRITLRKQWLPSDFHRSRKRHCSVAEVSSHHVTEEQAWVHRPNSVHHEVFLNAWFHEYWDDASKACLSGGQDNSKRPLQGWTGFIPCKGSFHFPTVTTSVVNWCLMWTLGGLTLKIWNGLLWMSKLYVLGNVSKS